MEDRKLATEDEKKEVEEIARKVKAPLSEIQEIMKGKGLEGDIYISKAGGLMLTFFTTGWRVTIDADGNPYLMYEYGMKI